MKSAPPVAESDCGIVERRKKNMTSEAHTSVIEERGCNEVYVFIYNCS